jgi:hypothetical protein
MIKYYLLRDGSDEDLAVRQCATEPNTIAANALQPLLVGRELAPAKPVIPTITNPATQSSDRISGFTGPVYVVIRADDANEARQIGATCGQYHHVRGLSPADIVAATIPNSPPRSWGDV